MNFLDYNKSNNLKINFSRAKNDFSSVDFRVENKMYKTLDNKIENEIFMKKVLGIFRWYGIIKIPALLIWR